MKLDTKTMVLTALFTALTAVAAFIQIPIPPVAITLQTAICIFAGCLLGAKAGAASQALYVIIGLCGVPIFSAGGGLSYVLKPSFGFLIGFILCAFVAGLLFKRLKKLSFLNVLAVSLAGLLALDVIGYPYMYFMLRSAMGMEANAAATVLNSALMFLPGDLLKCGLVALCVPPVVKRLGKAR